MSVYGIATYGSSTYGSEGGEPTEATYGSGSYGGGTYAQLELVTTPGEPVEPGIDVFPTFDIFQPPRLWRIVLADSNTMQNIGEVETNFSLELALNRPGSCNFSISLDKEIAEHFQAINTCIKLYRKDNLIWSGMVWNPTENLPDNQLTVPCVGWFEKLNHRLLRYEKNYQNDLWTGGQIALDLLAIANQQRTGPISLTSPDGTGPIDPTGIDLGISTDLQIRNKKYERWQNIGSAILDWTVPENGYDFEITPDTKLLNVHTNTVGSPLRRDRTQVQFGYNWGPNNLRTFSRQIDSSTIVTQMHAVGQFATATATASGSPGPLETYGLWEEQANLSEVTDLNVLTAYANGEVAVRSVPRTIYSINPFPFVEGGKVPEPFVDYKIGDQVYFTAKYLPRINIERQAVRVYGIKLTVDTEGNENIDDLQVSPN